MEEETFQRDEHFGRSWPMASGGPATIADRKGGHYRLVRDGQLVGWLSAEGLHRVLAREPKDTHVNVSAIIERMQVKAAMGGDMRSRARRLMADLEAIRRGEEPAPLTAEDLQMIADRLAGKPVPSAANELAELARGQERKPAPVFKLPRR